MSGLSEVPTEELLSFQDYPTIHTTATTNTNPAFIEAQLKVDRSQQNTFDNKSNEDKMFANEESSSSAMKSFWTIEYYQQFFDVDSRDVIDRLVYSIFPRKGSTYKHQMTARPDLYGPFWIAVTLVFTIAISGNIAKYLQHANQEIHWKYDFHLVSYAATAIFLYITVVPLALWGLLKWTSTTSDVEELEDYVPPRVLELICFYGYSLFIYIPVSILWTIQINYLQWILVAVAACLSGSVLLLALNSSIRMSKHKLFINIGIILLHLLLAAGFVQYFFHEPATVVSKHVQVVATVTAALPKPVDAVIAPLPKATNISH